MSKHIFDSECFTFFFSDLIFFLLYCVFFFTLKYCYTKASSFDFIYSMFYCDD